MTLEQAQKTGLLRFHHNDITNWFVRMPNGFETFLYHEALGEMIAQQVPSQLDLNHEYKMASAEYAFKTGNGFFYQSPWMNVPAPSTTKKMEVQILYGSVDQKKCCTCPTLLNGHWPGCGEK